jgi:hypothetical protein
MPGTVSESTTLDPRDIARELASIFERLGNIIAKGGPDEEHREEVVSLLARASSTMRAWAELGAWLTAPAEAD